MSPDDISCPCKVYHGDVTYDRGFFYQQRKLRFKQREINFSRLWEYNSAIGFLFGVTECQRPFQLTAVDGVYGVGDERIGFGSENKRETDDRYLCGRNIGRRKHYVIQQHQNDNHRQSRDQSAIGGNQPTQPSFSHALKRSHHIRQKQSQ